MYIRGTKIRNKIDSGFNPSDFFSIRMIFDYLEELILNNFGHKPTTDQAQAVKELARFILTETGSHRSLYGDVFILRGYAGTGKTSLVSSLVTTMEQLERKCVLMAPTGRAAKVFSVYSRHPAFTIHKRIYRQKSMDDDTIFQMGYNGLKNALFIVDEASMISNDATSSPYGSGRLLDDLVQYIYSGEGCRMILLGDTAQLPPVGETSSPALSPNVLRSYGLHVTCMTLTDVVRQDGMSGILHNATELRHLIEETMANVISGVGIHRFVLPHIRFTGDVRNVPGNELIEELANSYHNYGTDDTIVVCRSNKRAHVYNLGIRNQILDREEELSAGDMVMIAKNNYFWLKENFKGESIGKLPMNQLSDFIANGDTARVLKVRNERELYGFRFADCDFLLPDYSDLEIHATVLLDTLHTESPALSKEKSEMLFKNVLEDYADIPYKKERMKKMREDPYYNALQIKYAYAVTCHKAQGGQWSQVFIDQGFLSDDMIGVDYYRWLYTAFTRATDNVFLVNWRQEEPGD